MSTPIPVRSGISIDISASRGSNPGTLHIARRMMPDSGGTPQPEWEVNITTPNSGFVATVLAQPAHPAELGRDLLADLEQQWNRKVGPTVRIMMMQAHKIEVEIGYDPDDPNKPDDLSLEETLDPPLSIINALKTAKSIEEQYWNPALAARKAKPKADPIGTKPLAANAKEMQPITRPGGQVYYPRRYKGTTDVLFIRRAVEQGMNVLLIGAPGDGKTAVLEAALGLITTVSCDEGTTRSDFLGEGFFKPDGSTGYHWGPAPEALTHTHDSQCEEGCNLNILYADEVNAARPSEIKILHPMGDDRKVVHTTEHGALVKSPDFRLIASINPDEVGTYLSPALRSRFHVVINWTPDYSVAKRLGVPDVIVNSAIKLQKQKAAGEPIAALPSMRDLLAFRDVAKAFDIPTAWENLISSADPLAQAQWIEKLSNDAGLPEDIKPLAMLAEYMD
jgi:MoxR-like ATPase